MGSKDRLIGTLISLAYVAFVSPRVRRNVAYVSAILEGIRAARAARESLGSSTGRQHQHREPPPTSTAMPNCFSVLGLTGAVDERAIQEAFRKKALLLHPDKPNGDPAAFRRLMAARDEALRYLRIHLGGGLT